MPPTLLDPPPGDAFAERNQYAMKIDYERMPPMFPFPKPTAPQHGFWMKAPRSRLPSPSNAAVWSIEESGSLSVRNYKQHFPINKSLTVHAVNGDFFDLRKGNLRAGRGIRPRQVDGGARHYGHLYPDGRRDLLQRLSDLGKRSYRGAQEKISSAICRSSSRTLRRP